MTLLASDEQLGNSATAVELVPREIGSGEVAHHLPVSVTGRGMTMALDNARGKPAPGSGSPVRTIAPIAADGADLSALAEALPLEPPTPLPSTAFSSACSV